MATAVGIELSDVFAQAPCGGGGRRLWAGHDWADLREDQNTDAVDFRVESGVREYPEESICGICFGNWAPRRL